MKVAIIGGAGEMGAWFADFFSKRGLEVVISGRHYSKCAKLARRLRIKAAKNNVDAISGADLVMVSVLMSNFEKVVKEIAPHLQKGQKVIDVTSVKALPVRIMHRHMRRAVTLGTHPMFGPSAGAKGQNFILTPTNAKERAFARSFGGFLTKSGFRVYVISPAEHDKMIGMVLSLTHFVGLVTADAWKSLRIERYIETSSTSFRFLLQFAKSVVDSSPELYSYLQMDVPNVFAAERAFTSRAESWSRMVKGRRRALFMRRMTELSKYLNGLKLQ